MENELASYLLSLTLASSAGIVVALLIRGPVRHVFGSSAAYSLWILVPVALLAALLPHPVTPGSIGWSIGSGSAFSRTLLNHSLSDASGASGAAGPAMDWRALALAIWCAGGALFALYIALRQRAFVRSLGTLSASQSVRRTARADACPALLGVFRPKIILPADFRSRYTRSERVLIFSHERTHLRRGDPLCNGFVALMRCVFWFNPLAHLASSCFRLDQELACDAAVLREHPQSRRVYAGAMLKTQLADLTLPIGCHWHSARGLKQRVRMVKRRLPSRTRRLAGTALTALLAALVGCTTWTARPARSVPSESSAQIPGQVRGQVSLTAQSVQVLESSSGSLIEDVRKGRLTVGKSAGPLKLHGDSSFTSYALAAMLDPQGRMMRSGSWTGAMLSPAHTTAPTLPLPRKLPINYMILDGHVHVIFTTRAAPPAHPQTIVLDTNAAAIARQPDGSSIIQFDHGRLEFSSATSVVPASPTADDGAQRPGMLTPNFNGAELSMVASAVSVATHRLIVVDPSVHAQVNLINAKPITPEAFYQEFLALVHTHGFVAQQDGQVLKILPGPSSAK